MNFYENLFNMIEPFFFPTMFLQPPADFLWHFTVVSTLQSLGVHMTSCHLWLAEFVSSVIYCYMQLSISAKHSLDTFLPLCPNETLFPRIVHRVWKLTTAPNESVKMNQTKWRRGIFCHSQSNQVPWAILGWKKEETGRHPDRRWEKRKTPHTKTKS